MPVKVSASIQPLSRPLSRRLRCEPAHLAPNCDVGSTGRGHPFLNPHFSPLGSEGGLLGDKQTERARFSSPLPRCLIPHPSQPCP